MSTPIESLPRANPGGGGGGGGGGGPQVQDPTAGPPLPILQSNHPEPPPHQPQMEQQMPPQPMYYAPPPQQIHFPPPPQHHQQHQQNQQLPPKNVEEPTLWQMLKDNLRLVVFVFFILLLSQMEGVRTLSSRVVGLLSVPESMSAMSSKILVALAGAFLFIAGSIYVV